MLISHLSLFLFEARSCVSSSPGSLQNPDPPASASQVARIYKPAPYDLAVIYYFNVLLMLSAVMCVYRLYVSSIMMCLFKSHSSLKLHHLEELKSYK